LTGTGVKVSVVFEAFISWKYFYGPPHSKDCKVPVGQLRFVKLSLIKIYLSVCLSV